ncbi:fungal-specific transcription factor domain-containing protein [Aspergillus californicus]
MEDYNGPDSSGSPENAPRGPEIGHACNTCRKRKLRCSRELPACQHCRRTAADCQYETKRGKPGMKAGALDNIHRRLGGPYALERLVGARETTVDDSVNHTIISSLATGFRKPDGEPNLGHLDSGDGGPTKRRRTDADGRTNHSSYVDTVPPLPEDIILGQVFEAYFVHVHPWLPIIHESRFRRRLVDGEKEKLSVVIRSMMLSAGRFVEDRDTTTSLEASAKDPEGLRDWLVSQALKQPSIENLQALVIIANNDISVGQTFQAWPLVGSLSRMVEYLQLTVEHDDAVTHPFSQPYRSLLPPKDWTETEERRRIFWSIFAMDRFCSVSMGWNTSLTADDVRRRLPCDGITWRKEDPVVTPYFGIWDRSAGRIGNPIAFLPSQPTPVQTTEEEGEASPAGTSPGATSIVDMATVGAYAYCIEATESLSRVTTYFLQQKVNLNNQKEFGAWLTRFKELDLRLVHWKMLLPQKWTVDVTHQAVSRMDPNLTLAHVTHNASMILLHQPIAFPLPEWPFKSRLPSLCSRDTCQAAAIEVASITNHYLKRSLAGSPLSSQFAFCVFIAARALLLHWKHSPAQETVAPELWTLIQCLDSISSRAMGIHPRTASGGSLAAKYSSTLLKLHRRCAQDESYTINIAAYTSEVDHVFGEQQLRLENVGLEDHNALIPPVRQLGRHTTNTDTHNPVQSHRNPCNLSQIMTRERAPIPGTTAIQRIPLITPNAFSLNTDELLQPDLARDSEDAMAMSQMLLNHQFTDLDRVISYSDGIFGAEFEGLEERRW